MQPGDSLVAICAEHAPQVPDCIDAVLELNGIATADHIEVGQTLTLPQASTPPVTNTP